MLCHIREKAELNLLWGVSENRIRNQRVEVTEADIIFMELSNNETGCYVKLLVICPKVRKRELGMSQSIFWHCILKFLLKSKLAIKWLRHFQNQNSYSNDKHLLLLGIQKTISKGYCQGTYEHQLHHWNKEGIFICDKPSCKGVCNEKERDKSHY